MRFFVVADFVLLAAIMLCGCSSPSVPPWAAATLKSDYRAGMRVAQTSHPKRIRVARPIVNEVKVDEAKVDEAKLAERKLYDDQVSTGTVPSKFRYLKPFSEEWKQRQEEEAGRVKAATTICRC